MWGIEAGTWQMGVTRIGCSNGGATRRAPADKVKTAVGASAARGGAARPGTACTSGCHTSLTVYQDRHSLRSCPSQCWHRCRFAAVGTSQCALMFGVPAGTRISLADEVEHAPAKDRYCGHVFVF